MKRKDYRERMFVVSLHCLEALNLKILFSLPVVIVFLLRSDFGSLLTSHLCRDERKKVAADGFYFIFLLLFYLPRKQENE